ncbi:putative histone-lysine N-methyltransferase ASHR1 [Paratrimastix pyriformis]|uniref:Histone-lysine N-methyltransferase ASHR1 n=1 Tax=Paratrimastix pyriformis TaxID=342808 RepID=A0ABQ8UI82_9EUKA|nr:putative histone-lysine N-methyltransferase ASHR1 [Paratrimastix pyriformis]
MSLPRRVERFEVRRDATWGRHAVAVHALSPGDVVLCEQPYAYVLSKDHRETHCAYCLAPIERPSRCSKCHLTFYCSLECQRKDWGTGHCDECPALARLLPRVPTETILLAARLFRARARESVGKPTAAPETRYGDFAQLLSRPLRLPPAEVVDLDQADPGSLERYRGMAVLTLSVLGCDLSALAGPGSATVPTCMGMHGQPPPVPEEIVEAISKARQAPPLAMSPPPPPSRPQPSHTAISHSHLTQPSRTAISHSHLTQPSHTAISHSHLTQPSHTAISPQPSPVFSPPPAISHSHLPSAISPQPSPLSHLQCAPNCAIHFEGRSLIIRATAPVAPGEQLFVSYIEIAASRRTRQADLLKRYHFLCRCPRCLRDPHDPEEEGFQCPRCAEGLLSPLREDGREVGPLRLGGCAKCGHQADEATCREQARMLAALEEAVREAEDRWNRGDGAEALRLMEGALGRSMPPVLSAALRPLDGQVALRGSAPSLAGGDPPATSPQPQSEPPQRQGGQPQRQGEPQSQPQRALASSSDDQAMALPLRLHPLNSTLLRVTSTLTHIHITRQAFDRALVLCRATIPPCRVAYPHKHPVLGLQLFTLGKLEWFACRARPALSAFVEAREILAITHGSESPLVQELCGHIQQAEDAVKAQQTGGNVALHWAA